MRVVAQCYRRRIISRNLLKWSTATRISECEPPVSFAGLSSFPSEWLSTGESSGKPLFVVLSFFFLAFEKLQMQLSPALALWPLQTPTKPSSSSGSRLDGFIWFQVYPSLKLLVWFVNVEVPELLRILYWGSLLELEKFFSNFFSRGVSLKSFCRRARLKKVVS